MNFSKFSRAKPSKNIRGPGWSPLPWRLAQGFSLKILFIGGVHKLMILQRDFVDDFLTKFFGEEMGGGQGDPDPLVSKQFILDKAKKETTQKIIKLVIFSDLFFIHSWGY